MTRTLLAQNKGKCNSNAIIPQDKTRQTNLALALIQIQLGGTETH